MQVAELRGRLLVGALVLVAAAADLVGEAVVLVLLRGDLAVLGLLVGDAPRRGRAPRVVRSSSAICLPLSPQPPIGALGFAPQKTSVPIIPMMCTKTMLSTIDFAVAVPTPTGPPEAV